MRRSTLVLSLTTAIFATSTSYLGWQLHIRGDDPGNGSTLASTPTPSKSGTGANGSAAAASDVALDPAKMSAAPGPAGIGATAPDAATSGVSKGDAAADATLSFARQQLVRFNDPAQRAALVNDALANTRRQYARLREQLKLSDATFEQVVALMAEQSLQAQEIYLRCAADPACKAEDNYKQHPVDDHSQELLALLGADKADALTKYQASLPERDAVAQLRGRLTEFNAIRDEQAEQLVLALAEERDRFQKETSARGSQSMGWGTNLGMIFYSGDSNSIEQRLTEASQYSQRLRQRAALVLSPAQLAAYNQMQDELLAQMAAYLRPASTSNKQRV